MKTPLPHRHACALVWVVVVLTSIQFLLGFVPVHRSSAETALLSPAAQVHDVYGEVVDSSAEEVLSPAAKGNRRLRSLLPAWTLASAVAPLSGVITLATASDRPAGVTTYRLFVRKCSVPDPDDDVLRG